MGESAEDQAAALPNVQPSARPNAEPSALPGSQPTLAPSTRVLLSLAGAVILLVGMSLARDVLTPLFVAAVLVIIVHPVRTPLERHGWPRWLATTAVIAVAYLVLAVLGAIVLFAAGQFAALIPQHADELHIVVDQGAGLLTSLGFDADAAADATRRIDPATLVNAAGAIVHTVTGLATSFFWTFVIGPVGAILSVPLTLLLRALLLENDDDAAWVRRLSGDMSDETGNTGSEARTAA
ncbi:AI-2E family transporter [Plantibacter sp. YIM 135249]|uniref:AI-2E family transporter n=1 Tax=Plantibacter sp. YIM 135249 TaxID=3423918 RepID=UPI003D34E63A